MMTTCVAITQRETSVYAAALYIECLTSERAHFFYYYLSLIMLINLLMLHSNDRNVSFFFGIK